MMDGLTQPVSTSELNSIAKSAERSLKFIELWKLLGSSHSAISNIVQDVQTQGQAYCQAIDMSVKTAGDGSAFTTDAIDLCDFLLREDATPEELEEYISEMQETAKSAHEAATESSNKFRFVHRDLSQTMKHMCAARLSVPHKSSTATVELSQVTEGLMTAIRSVDAFANWWLGVDKTLSAVEKAAGSMNSGPHGVSRLNVDTIQEHWQKIHDEYQHYQSKIAKLWDIYQTKGRHEVVLMDDALAQLVSISESDIGLDSTLKGAEESLKFIEPWGMARSEHPVVIKIIQDVQVQGRVYCQAIDMSVKTADDGCAFTIEAIDLCDFLLSDDTTPEELVDYISEMRETAISAHRAASETSRTFRTVRTGLFEIAKLIPAEVAKIADAEANAEATRLNADFFGCLVMPEPRGVASSQDVAPSERPPVSYDFGAAITQLGEAMDGLVTLTKSVDVFANWWLTIDTALATVETSAASLKSGARGVSRLKVDSIRKRWEKVSTDYQDYKLKITRLRDIYQRTHLGV